MLYSNAIFDCCHYSLDWTHKICHEMKRSVEIINSAHDYGLEIVKLIQGKLKYLSCINVDKKV